MRQYKLISAARIRGSLSPETVETVMPRKIDLALGLITHHLIKRINAVLEARMQQVLKGELRSPYPQRDAEGRPITTIAVGVDPLRLPLARMACNADPFELRGLSELIFGESLGDSRENGLEMIRAALQQAMDKNQAGFVVLEVSTGLYPDQRVKTLVVTIYDPVFAEEFPHIVAKIPRLPRRRLTAERTVIHQPEMRTTTELAIPVWFGTASQ